MKEELQVKAIKSGTVIDHIEAKNLFKIVSILMIENIDTELLIGNNFDSNKLGKKGIIKISNKFPSEDDLNKIALIDPNAMINIIENYKVVKKYKVGLPKNVNTFVKCINPKCITNFEKVSTKFAVHQKEGKVELKCDYCEKVTNQDNIEIIK